MQHKFAIYIILSAQSWSHRLHRFAATQRKRAMQSITSFMIIVTQISQMAQIGCYAAEEGNAIYNFIHDYCRTDYTDDIDKYAATQRSW